MIRFSIFVRLSKLSLLDQAPHKIKNWFFIVFLTTCESWSTVVSSSCCCSLGYRFYGSMSCSGMENPLNVTMNKNRTPRVPDIAKVEMFLWNNTPRTMKTNPLISILLGIGLIILFIPRLFSRNKKSKDHKWYPLFFVTTMRTAASGGKFIKLITRLMYHHARINQKNNG